MRKSIELEGYRGFSSYKLEGLSRVNLLVGKNNCGKTSILEAVRLLGSGGDPGVLSSIAFQRGELIYRDDETERHRPIPAPNITHFFNGHNLSLHAMFRIWSDKQFDEFAVRVILTDDLDEQAGLFPENEDAASEYRLELEGATHPSAKGRTAFALTEDGALLLPNRYPRLLSDRLHREQIGGVGFIGPDSLKTHTMSGLWDKVILNGDESEVIETMRILLPRLSNIFFLSGKNSDPYKSDAGIIVAIHGEKQRFPLGSLGDGMRRLLALSISLNQLKGGTLLIDEIDSGLHYSIMGDLWLFVVQAAVRLDIQVFATTHSFDCLRGLAWLCEKHPELGREVSVQKIDPALNEAVGLDAEQIVVASNQGIEMR